MTTITSIQQRALTQALAAYGRVLLEELASEYKFSADEASTKYLLAPTIKSVKKDRMDRPKKEEKLQASIPLPFAGRSERATCCNGIRLNHGLYTQCTNDHMASGEYCQTCQKQADVMGKPTYGTIEDRVACDPMEYRDPKGKKVVSYGNVLKKLGIDADKARQEAARVGITLEDHHFTVVVGKRGRPKKSNTVSDTESDASDAPKKRGRPAKKKEVANGADDLISALALQVSGSPEVPAIEEPAQERSQAQISAFEKAKRARAAKLAEKKKAASASSSDDEGDVATPLVQPAAAAPAQVHAAPATSPAATSPATSPATVAPAPAPPSPKKKKTKCTIVLYKGVKYAITANNEAYYADGDKKGEFYGNYDPTTKEITEYEDETDEEDDSDDDSEE